jgi:hypothetical protein
LPSNFTTTGRESRDEVTVSGYKQGKGTDMAIPFGEHMDDDTVWLPRSQVTFVNSEPEKEGPITITMPLWLAEKKGLA